MALFTEELNGGIVCVSPHLVYAKTRMMTKSNNRYKFVYETQTTPLTVKMAFVNNMNRHRPVLDTICNVMTPQKLLEKIGIIMKRI